MYTASVQRIDGGRPGLVQKVRQIRRLVERSKRDPHFRARVAELVADVGEKDHQGEIGRLVDYTREGIRYLRDPWSPGGLELFVDPRTMMRDVDQGRAAGDCDDHVLLASAMLETAGYPTRYRVGGVPPDHYRHIWLDVHSPSAGWIPVELTKKDAPIGWDPSPRFPLVETFGEKGNGTMRGLGQIQEHRRPIARLVARRAPRIRYGRRARQRNAPASFHNVYRGDGIYAGATPSDFFRATEIRTMAPRWSPIRHSPLLGLEHACEPWPDELAGFSRYFKRVTKQVKRSLPEIVGVGATVIGGPQAGLIAYQITGSIQEARKAEKQAKAAEAAAAAPPVKLSPLAAAAVRNLAAGAAAAQGTSIPASNYSTKPGPSYYQATQGFALPSGVPDQVAVLDQQPTPVVYGPPPPSSGPSTATVVAIAAAAGIPLLLLLLRRR